MERLKSIFEKHSRWQPYSLYIDRIEGFRTTEFSICVENAKALLESIAKEICTQKRQPLTNKENVSKLLGLSFGCLGYAPSETVRQIGTAIANIAQQMGNFRNEIGNTAHGKTLNELSRREEIVSNLTGEFLINATEIVCCFLIETFEADNPIAILAAEVAFDDNIDFNEFLDSLYGEFKMTEDYTYTASEILFSVDQEAYKSELNAFKLAKNETDNGE